jgi:pseudaminic acid cytidylyltransferase
MKLCVIPARGGSKRIPRKNIHNFSGKPMIAWAIEGAQASGCFDQIIVSTDSSEIANVAREWGALVPFMRPAALADDYTDTTAVIAHAVEWHQNSGQVLEAVCCLYATAALVDPLDIHKGLQLLYKVAHDRFVFTATEYSPPIERALRLDKTTGVAYMRQKNYYHTRSQDLEASYHDAGQFYWGRPQAWLAASNLFEGSTPLVLPRSMVQDIDSYEDMIRAELIFRLIKNRPGYEHAV